MARENTPYINIVVTILKTPQNFRRRKKTGRDELCISSFDPHFNFFVFISWVMTSRFCDFVPPATRVMENGAVQSRDRAKWSSLGQGICTRSGVPCSLTPNLSLPNNKRRNLPQIAKVFNDAVYSQIWKADGYGRDRLQSHGTTWDSKRASRLGKALWLQLCKVSKA